MSNNIQNMYRPVPQSLSDSDSEKELQMDPVHTSFAPNNHMTLNPYQRDYQKHFTIPGSLLRSKLKKPQRQMSNTRKFFFCLSILVCFLTIAIFLWVLPCSTEYECPVRISNWDKQLESFELIGRISTIRNKYKHVVGLGVLFLWNVLGSSEKSGGMGVFSDVSGEVLWMERNLIGPRFIDCESLDVNLDGASDCLVVTKSGVAVFDGLDGTTHWYVHDHNRPNKLFVDLDAAFVITDFNNDRVNEIVIAEGNSMILIDGRTGMAIYYYTFKDCLDVNIKSYERNEVTYSCRKIKNKLSYLSLPVSDLQSKFSNTSFMLTPKPANLTDGKYQIQNTILHIDNVNKCPTCQAKILLYNASTNKTILNKTYSRMFASKPKKFQFKNSTRNNKILRGHINGFVLKLWEYPDDTKNHHLDILNNTVRVNYLKERTIIITFNDTDIHVINSSITDFTQFCLFENDQECQPSISNQVDSMLINDLDEDGKLELISFTSSFAHDRFSNSTNDSWRLLSGIKVFHLESEFPKLYEIAEE